MTTTTLVAPIRENTAGVHARPGLGRLVAVELRKMVDTRAGFWLLAASALLAIAVVGLTLAFGHATDLMFGVFFERTVGTLSVLLPVVGISPSRASGPSAPRSRRSRSSRGESG
jgi:hypothetical protein